MFNTELTVVNACLKTLGEARVNSLDEDHSMVPEARDAFTLCNTKEQARKWWFNSEYTMLTRNVDGFVYVPADAIAVYPDDDMYVQRGRRLYFLGTRTVEAGFAFPLAGIMCHIVRMVPYEDLPVSVQNLISYSTQLEFMTGYDADSNRFQQISNAYRDAYIEVNAEHIRSIKTNLFRAQPLGYRLMNIGGNNNSRIRTPGAYQGG